MNGLPPSDDQAGWHGLFEAWHPGIRGYLHRLLPDAGDAEEIATETFATAWRTSGRFTGGNVSTWLFGIAINLARNRRRRWLRRLARFTGMTSQDFAAEVEDSADTDTRAALVRTAIKDLPESLREPLLLTVYAGLSHQEAAAALGLTPKAVEHRVATARERLRKVLSGPDFER
jgi:RNA polymerase sigma-70 factor (ECF subfamily)